MLTTSRACSPKVIVAVANTSSSCHLYSCSFATRSSWALCRHSFQTPIRALSQIPHPYPLPSKSNNKSSQQTNTKESVPIFPKRASTPAASQSPSSTLPSRPSHPSPPPPQPNLQSPISPPPSSSGFNSSSSYIPSSSYLSPSQPPAQFHNIPSQPHDDKLPSSTSMTPVSGKRLPFSSSVPSSAMSMAEFEDAQEMEEIKTFQEIFESFGKDDGTNQEEPTKEDMDSVQKFYDKYMSDFPLDDEDIKFDYEDEKIEIPDSDIDHPYSILDPELTGEFNTQDIQLNNSLRQHHQQQHPEYLQQSQHFQQYNPPAQPRIPPQRLRLQYVHQYYHHHHHQAVQGQPPIPVRVIPQSSAWRPPAVAPRITTSIPPPPPSQSQSSPEQPPHFQSSSQPLPPHAQQPLPHSYHPQSQFSPPPLNAAHPYPPQNLAEQSHYPPPHFSSQPQQYSSQYPPHYPPPPQYSQYPPNFQHYPPPPPPPRQTSHVINRYATPSSSSSSSSSSPHALPENVSQPSQQYPTHSPQPSLSYPPYPSQSYPPQPFQSHPPQPLMQHPQPTEPFQSPPPLESSLSPPLSHETEENQTSLPSSNEGLTEEEQKLLEVAQSNIQAALEEEKQMMQEEEPKFTLVTLNKRQWKPPQVVGRFPRPPSLPPRPKT